MRRLQKEEKPKILKEREAEWTTEYLACRASGDKLPSRWRHPQIKSALTVETNERCAYCDSTMAVVNFPHVEHILPKKVFPELVVAWTNLTLVCERCNNEKLDYYSQSTPLLNPYEDDADEHLLFVGPWIFPRPGSDRGLVTVRRLGLARQPLTSQRLRRVEQLLSLLDSWARADPEDVKSELFKIIADDVRTGPYQKSALAILRSYGIDLNL